MRAPDLSDERAAALTELLRRVREGEQHAKGQLFDLLRNGIACLVSRQLGTQDSEDIVHDVYLIVLRAIEESRLRDPERLLAYTRVVTRRRIANGIRENVKRRARDSGVDPEDLPASGSQEDHAVRQEQVKIMNSLLLELKPKEREVLVRFYLKGESEERICREMELTATQFRLLKWRAKARFADLAGQKYTHPSDPRKAQ